MHSNARRATIYTEATYKFLPHSCIIHEADVLSLSFQTVSHQIWLIFFPYLCRYAKFNDLCLICGDINCTS